MDPNYFNYSFDNDGKENPNGPFFYRSTRFEDGVGVVLGEGKLPDFESKVVRLWAGDTNAMGVSKLVVGDPEQSSKITRIGAHCFEGMYNLTEVTLYRDLQVINKTAFKDCDNLHMIHYNGNRSQWETLMYNSAMDLVKDLSGVQVKLADGMVIPQNVSGSNCFVNIERSSYSYTGSQICPKVHVFYKNTELIENKDYTVSYGPNKDEDGYVRVVGKRSFTGSKAVTFKITPITKNVTLSVSDNILTVGGKVKIESTLSDKKLYKLRISNENIVKNGVNSYVEGLACGEVTVKAIPVNKHKCTINSNVIKLTVVPPKVNLSTGSKDGYIYLRWNKIDSADGYYIYRDNKKIKTIKKDTTTNYVDKKAKKNGGRYKYMVISYSKSTGFIKGESKAAWYLSKPKIKSIKLMKDSRIQIKWSKNSKCTGYEIKYSMDNFKHDIVTS